MYVFTRLLNGSWAIGDDRRYDGVATVPGIQRDPAAPQRGALWFKKDVALPDEPFTRLSVLLRGARFRPAIYINGDFVAESEGGMAPIRFVFAHAACVPGATVALEICLRSLADVPMSDASRISDADQWRTNVSSGLWDDVVLTSAGDIAVTDLIYAIAEDGRGLTARVALDGAAAGSMLTLRLCAPDGSDIAVARRMIAGGDEQISLPLTLPVPLLPWEPTAPHLYVLTAEVESCGGVSALSTALGWRRFAVDGLGFTLNGHPETLRGVSVAWHRFCRDPEGRLLAFDRVWFARTILDRLAALGANFLRVHLGVPPEWLLDEADARGFCVQIEWIFFHGLPASEDSLRRQWRALLALAARHPCVCVVHPWNETDAEETEMPARVLSALCKEFPPVVLSHRDVTHLHKYWWSLFENLSLCFDGADDFDRPVIADEFGGNYLDGAGEPGLYPDAAVAFERFLGAITTRAERMELQALANGRVAEYWRRIGVAGYATVFALSSPEDGSNHFLGALADGVPMPVWEACSAAFARRAACLELWDRAFYCGQTVTVPVWFFRSEDSKGDMTAVVEVIDERGAVTYARTLAACPPAWGKIRADVPLTLPPSGDTCVLRAYLQGERARSAWPVRLYAPLARARSRTVCVLDGDPELCAFVRENGMKATDDPRRCDVLLGGQRALESMNADPTRMRAVEEALRAGAGLLLTQIGPRLLGEGYIAEKRGIRTDGLTVSNERAYRYRLPLGMEACFDALPEPESCCHRAPGSERFWRGLHRQALQLSNGYRGGLNAPAADMRVEGVGRAAFAAQWRVRGADVEALRHPNYTGYELCGFFAFSDAPCADARDALRARVRALVKDAPSLAARMDAEGEIVVHPLGRQYAALSDSGAVEAIARCGRELLRAPAVFVRLGDSRMILSQLLTGGRLSPAFSESGRYGARYDPEHVRLLRNMLDVLADS